MCGRAAAAAPTSLHGPSTGSSEFWWRHQSVARNSRCHNEIAGASIGYNDRELGRGRERERSEAVTSGSSQRHRDNNQRCHAAERAASRLTCVSPMTFQALATHMRTEGVFYTPRGLLAPPPTRVQHPQLPLLITLPLYLTGVVDCRLSGVVLLSTSFSVSFLSPHCRLTPNCYATPSSISMNLIPPESRLRGLHFCC